MASQYDPLKSWNDETANASGMSNADLVRRSMPTYLCPSMPRPDNPQQEAGWSSYALSRGNFKYLVDPSGAVFDFIKTNTAGVTTTTKMFGEDDGLIPSAFVYAVPTANHQTYGPTSNPSGVLRVLKMTSVTDGLSQTVLAGDKHYTLDRAAAPVWVGGFVNNDSTGGAAMAGKPFVGNTNWVLAYPGSDGVDGTTNSPMNSAVVRCKDGAATMKGGFGEYGCPATGPEDNSDAAWYKNTAITAFRSLHTGGVNFAFGDGSVRFVRDTIDLQTYRALGSRAGGETVGSW